MAFYMHMWFSFSFGESWTNIGYCDQDPRLHSSSENLFPNDANLQTNKKLSFWKGSQKRKKRQNEARCCVIIFTAFHAKKTTNSNRGRDYYATLWLILKGYYKKQWLLSNYGSEVSEDLIQKFSSGSRPPFTCKTRPAAPKSLEIWENQSRCYHGNRGNFQHRITKDLMLP